jgi:hypothetical protein
VKALIGTGNITKKLAANTNEVILKQNRSTPSRVVTLQLSTDKKIQAPFQPFQVGSLGNFPYYWQNPDNLSFNSKTYQWISSSLKAGRFPVQLSQPFTNLYIAALSKVNYSLSNSDQSQLNQAQSNIINQQGALLKAWQTAFGTIPDRTETQQPIDIIFDTITQTWASPSITLSQLQISHDINGLLNNVPMSGKSILPVLVNYLNALQSSVTLINAATMNRGYLQQAMAAVQTPSTTNGGVSTSDGRVQPAYQIDTPLENILQSLNSTDRSKIVTLSMSVISTGGNSYSIQLNDGTTETLRMADFLNIYNEHGIDLFRELLLSDRDKAIVDVTFKGVTTVNFGPVYFSRSSNTHWYWMPPIEEALNNGDKDISGFKFSPKPQIDFSKSGPFGFLTSAVISKQVSLKITAKCANYSSIAEKIKSLGSAHFDFLGMPIDTASETSPGYQPSVSIDEKDTSLIITLEPFQKKAMDSMNSTAFVLGVQTNYPLSSSAR